MNTDVRADTLLGAALAPIDWTRSVGLVVVFSLFIAAAAQFAIHIGPIPITGQSFAVLLTGALLGSRLGAAAVIAYLIEGAVGLPFFAPGGAPGILRFFGATGGYLVAFPAAAFVTVCLVVIPWTTTLPRPRWPRTLSGFSLTQFRLAGNSASCSFPTSPARSARWFA